MPQTLLQCGLFMVSKLASLQIRLQQIIKWPVIGKYAQPVRPEFNGIILRVDVYLKR